MATKVQKWGNSLAVRLPKNITERFGLSEGSPIEIVPAQKDLRIIPKKTRTPSLNELVRGITKKNRHNETLWGDPVGSEVW